MAEIKEAKLNDLIQDDRNLNKGTERGQQLIEKSLREFGAGRSVLIDKNNRIIAGNKTHKNAELAGLDDVIIVETDGTKLVAVKRTDVDLDTKKGREMALADNATVKVDLEWDVDELESITEDFGIDAIEWGLSEEEKKATELLSELKVNDVYYEPKEIPNIKLSDCIDDEKFKKKVEFIDSLAISKEKKETLKMFAYRFLKIDYESVANYYAFNADEEERKAMERLRLVLVDGAIGGFIEDDLLRVSEQFEND